MVYSNYEIGFKQVKEKIPGRELQESHKTFSATFKRMVAGIESNEDSKIKILREFKVAKCLKGGEIFLNNALNWTKILQFLITDSKNTKTVNKVECLKYKKGSYLHFKQGSKISQRGNCCGKIKSRKSQLCSATFSSLKASCLSINTQVIYTPVSLQFVWSAQTLSEIVCLFVESSQRMPVLPYH